MATTNKITNAIALAAAINIFEGMEPDTMMGEFTVKEHTDKLRKMLNNATKKRTGEKTETLEQRKNREVFIPAILRAMAAHGEPVTTKWVSDNVNGIMTVQKATSLLTKCVKEFGTIERIQDGRKVMFKITEKGIKEIEE